MESLTTLEPSWQAHLHSPGYIFGLIGAFTAYYYFNCHILGRMSELALDSIKITMVMNLLGHIKVFIEYFELIIILTYIRHCLCKSI